MDVIVEDHWLGVLVEVIHIPAKSVARCLVFLNHHTDVETGVLKPEIQATDSSEQADSGRRITVADTGLEFVDVDVVLGTEKLALLKHLSHPWIVGWTDRGVARRRGLKRGHGFTADRALDDKTGVFVRIVHPHLLRATVTLLVLAINLRLGERHTPIHLVPAAALIDARQFALLVGKDEFLVAVRAEHYSGTSLSSSIWNSEAMTLLQARIISI
jgi:hypothetical protein